MSSPRFMTTEQLSDDDSDFTGQDYATRIVCINLDLSNFFLIIKF